MARYRSIQSSFTAGELDPLVKARVDIKAYFNGAEKMRNVLALPQGGFRRRPGLRYMAQLPNAISRITSGVTATAPNGGTAANANDDSVSTEVATTTEIQSVNPYVVAHYDLGSAKTVQFADVVGFRLSAGSNATEWVIQYSTDNAAWTTLGDPVPATTSNRHRRSTGPITARYWRFARVGTTDMDTATAFVDEFTLWENASPAALSDARIVDFTFSSEQEYIHVFTDRNVSVWKDDVKQCDVRSPYTSAQLASLSWTQNLDTLLCCYNQVRPQKLQRQGADDAWQFDDWTLNNIPTYQFEYVTTATGTPAAASGTGINFTAGAATFVAGDVGKVIRGNGGIATITAFTSSTVVVVSIQTAFADTTAIAAGAWTLEEAVWSTTRGWQNCATFFQGRLIFGGSYSRPQSIWTSRSGNYEDFDSRKNADDYGINATADTDDVSEIFNVYAGRHLTFFASSAEFYVPISEDTPLAPDNFVIRRSTRVGSQGPGIRCFDVAGALIFLQREGKALREFLYVFNEQNYQANPLSLLASHLMVSPVDTALRRSTSTSEADYLLLVNSDGTLTVLCTLRTQEITAFTLCSTDGLFKRCGALPTSDMYFVVERTINGATVRYLERFDDDLVTDAATTGTGVAASAAVPWLTGETCAVVLDGGFVQPDETATGGTVTFERSSVSAYEVGLHFPYVNAPTNSLRWMVRDMPVEGDLPDGSMIGRKKRIVEATLRLYQTLGIKVNGERIPFQQFGSSLLDQAVSPYTGDKTIGPLLGWDEMGQLTVGDDLPAKATVLGMLKKVAV